MGDSLPADGKKRKAKKMKRGLASTEQLDDVAIPPILLPCSTCITDTSSCLLTKKICFWGEENLSRSISWFVVNISMDVKHQPIEEMNDFDVFDHYILHRHIERGVKDITLTPVFSLPSRNPIIPIIYNTYATLGSFVYSIGGFYSYPVDTTLPGCNLVFCIDTNNKDENNCWKEAPSMISHRQKSQVITVNDKLYVFGCFGQEQCPHNPKCCSWAEVFDPLTGNWSSLPVPMFEDSLVVCSPNHIKKNHIVKKIAALVDEIFVFELDIKTNSWDRIATLRQVYCGNDMQPALVNNTFYWFMEDANAYDIIRDEDFEGPVQDYSFHHAMNMVSQQYDASDASKTKVLHLGRRYFCILGNLSNLKEASRRIHCAVIKLSKTRKWYKQHSERRPDVSKFFLRARVLMCQSFPIDRELKFLDGRIM